eukprot:COSAG06_NODE_5489_length_3446_cov_2.584105_1_plen_858_part_00
MECILSHFSHSQTNLECDLQCIDLFYSSGQWSPMDQVCCPPRGAAARVMSPARVSFGRATMPQHVSRQPAAPLPYHIPLADVAVGERIGGGALGEVRVGACDGNQVALKSLHMLRTDDAAQAEWGGALSPAERGHQLALFVRECETLRGLDHRNILPFIGVVVDQDSEPLYLATQFIPGGTLHDLIHHARYAQLRDEAGCLPLLTQLAVAHDIFAGLSYLAGKHLIHRDIKPANILAVTENGQLVKVLLADFGESKQLTLTVTRAAGTVAGTPLYMAPEMHEEEDAKGPKADVFSAGVVLVEMGSGRQPNPGPERRRRQLVPEEERRAEDMRAVHHPQIADLARRCIVDDDGARASAAELEQMCAAMRAELEQQRGDDGADDRMAEATLYVKLLDGQRVGVQATASTTVAELIGRVVAELGRHRLVFAGRRLDPIRTVDDYNLLDGTQVHMLTVTTGSGDAQVERERREEIEVLNAQLHEENERLRAQVDTAVAAADQERLRVARLERELAAARLERQGGGGRCSGRGEDVVPGSAIEAVAQQRASMVVRGRVLAFGRNDYGQLGDGSTTDRHSHVEIASSLGGDNAQVAAGGNHSLILKTDGRVLAFGRNDCGQLGDGSTTDHHSPVEIASLGGDNAQVVAGNAHSLILKTDGRVLAFGSNSQGQLGDGSTTDRHSPVEIASLGGDNAQVAAGNYHSLILKTDGRVLAFGYNGYGQLGDGSTTRISPVEIASLGGDNAQVVAGGCHSLILKTDGRVLAFGSNGQGQLGDGSTTQRHSPVEIASLGGDNAQVAAGGCHSLILKTDGRVLAFGHNDDGQVGDGSTTRRHSPVEIASLGGDNAQVAAGGCHSLILRGAS